MENTLAYYCAKLNTTVISFVVQALSRPNTINLLAIKRNLVSWTNKIS